jgi:rod shape determining protein RodA
MNRTINTLKAKRNFLSPLFHNFAIDRLLVLSILSVFAFGLVAIFSASNQDPVVLQKQLIRIFISLIVFCIAAKIKPIFFKLYAPFFYCMSFLVLCFVLVLGETHMGATRWISLGFIKFQPSEIVKIVMPLSIAWIIVNYGSPNTIRKLTLYILIGMLPSFLIFKQPDLGTAILVFLSSSVIIFVSGIPKRFILYLFVIGIVLLPVMWSSMEDYQQQRVMTILSPESDPLGTGYHIIQSKIAIGAGGMAGAGWLDGTQTHLGFIPEQRTDFIFSVIMEEFGFVGFIILCSLYGILIGRLLFLALRMNGSFEKMVSCSFIFVFVSYIFINMGMTSGIFPVVGIPLPLISYGGTSMLTLMFSFGLISSFYSSSLRVY